jgi:hypothetical protein
VHVALKRRSVDVAARILSTFAAYWRGDCSSLSSLMSAVDAAARATSPAHSAGDDGDVIAQAVRDKASSRHAPAKGGASSATNDEAAAPKAAPEAVAPLDTRQCNPAETEAVLALSRMLAVAAGFDDIRGAMEPSVYMNMRLREVRREAGWEWRMGGSLLRACAPGECERAC